MKKIIALSFLAFFALVSCNQNGKNETKKNKDESMVKTLSEEAMTVRDYVKKDIVIAHRGSKFWAPESTEPAFRWSRNFGTDYLEFDVQLTKDSVLVAFHDSDLKRTTNIAEVFPERMDKGINDFTLKELRKLDAGSRFNSDYPEQARESFKGLTILSMKDVVMIAEGYRIKQLDGQPEKEMVSGEWTGHYLYEKDTEDNGNRPGIYIETKSPKQGTERILANELTDLGWNINENSKEIKTQSGKISIANTNARLILQSFSRKSIIKLDSCLPNSPKCFLLWQPKMGNDLKANLIEAINFGVENNAHIIGGSIAGEPNNYGELTAPWMTELIHNAGMLIHPYTFDTNEQFIEYKERVDGMFTNRVDLALKNFNRESDLSPEKCFEELGY